jgi:hypothetical protein
MQNMKCVVTNASGHRTDISSPQAANTWVQSCTHPESVTAFCFPGLCVCTCFYTITPWGRVLEKHIVVQLVAKLTTFYATQSYIPCSQELSTFPYPEPDETNVQLAFPSRLFSSGFLVKAVYKFLFFRVCATCPVHHMSLDLTTLTMFGEEHKS